jgi:hypothetical protein
MLNYAFYTIRLYNGSFPLHLKIFVGLFRVIRGYRFFPVQDSNHF